MVVLASGVYISSFIKDLVCSPRPFSPPVNRLSTCFFWSVTTHRSTYYIAIGTHHLEYGFPSTHSTNSVSMALFMFGQVHSAYSDHSAISGTTYWILCGILVLYAISIVFGRIYTGMHSFTDCGVGVALGAAIWAAYMITSNTIERWLESGSWIGKTPCSRIVLPFDKRRSQLAFSSFCAGAVVPLAGTLSSAASR